MAGAATWRPNPGRQLQALKSPAYELLVGGAAGGGKSEMLLMAALRYVALAEYQGILFRRTFPELETSLIPRSKLWYPKLGGRYNDTKHVWRFPSGAAIWLGHLEHEDDVEQYQSAEFQFEGFDELTLFTEKQYRRMLARARSSAGIPIRIRAGTNPGGEGADWVQRRWAPWLGMPPGESMPRGMLTSEAGKPLWYVNDEEGERWLSNEEAQAMLAAWHAAPPLERVRLQLPLQRVFVPAKVSDNPKLMEADPGYVGRLMGLDPVRRAQLLHGDWNIRPAAGLYFKRGWFPRLNAKPTGYRWVRHWDLAGTEPEAGADPDWTIGCLLGMSADDAPKLCVGDVKRDRLSPAGVEALILKTALADGPEVEISLPQDPGQAGKFQAKYLVAKLQGFTVHAEPESGDKVTRAGPISSQCEAGNVSLVNGEWNEAFLNVLERFPEGKKDDVDALSGGYRHLVGQGPPPSYGTLPVVVPWSRRR